MADSRIYLQSQPLLPIGNTTSAAVSTGKVKKTDVSFVDFLSQAEKQLTFSQHALERMQSRNLNLSAQDMTRLGDTVDKMAQKGARESLIYLNDIALVVSVANRTVITAMDGMHAKNNIFTNIDSAAIL
jgi:flagellar operon protein